MDLAEVGLPLLDEPHHPAERNCTHQHTKDRSASIAVAVGLPARRQAAKAPAPAA
ncbi:hypothetical protein OIM90_23135 [Streptomyces sp. AD16]|nr:hypothetical protein OIM90_23135 [Streptomyces sp. AD16]